MSEPKVIGILGAGRVGTAIARSALAAGYEVRVASSRPASDIALVLQFTAPGAVAGDTADVIAHSDIIVLALPLSKYRSLDAAALSGKIVVDAMNYWAPTDGTLPEFETGRSSSEVIAEYLEDARLVRSFNHMGYHEMDASTRPAGHPERRALALAGDDRTARDVVAGFIDRLGFDPVDAGPLAAAGAFATGTPIFGAGLRHDELQAALRAPLAA